jgi:sugar lactone lactonase YvrE
MSSLPLRSPRRRPASRHPLLATLSLIALAACGGGGNDSGAARSGVTVMTALSADRPTVAPGETVWLSADCSGNGSITYGWDAGDGKIPEPKPDNRFPVVYDNEGEYMPKVTCTDRSDAQATSAANAYVRVAVPAHTVTGLGARVLSTAGETARVELTAECHGRPGTLLGIDWDYGDGDGTGDAGRDAARDEGSTRSTVVHDYDSSRSIQYTATARCNARADVKELSGRTKKGYQEVTGTTTVAVASADRQPVLTMPLSVDPIVPTTAGATVFRMRCTAGAGESIEYTFDFGDDSDPETNTTGVASYTYAPDGQKAAVQHTVRATCAASGPLSGGRVQSQSALVSVRTPLLSLLAGKTDRPRSIQRMALAADGTVYLSQTEENALLRMKPGEAITPFVGNGKAALVNGQTASFDRPGGMAMGPDGFIYVADTLNHAIRAVNPEGSVTTLAGGVGAGSNDGPRGAASFYSPTGIAIDRNGTVYVADTLNHLIRTIDRDGVVGTLAGRTGEPGLVDGPLRQAKFNRPVALAIDADGTLYVAEQGNHALRRISGDTVSTLAGNGTANVVDDIGTAARFNEPIGIALDGAGKLYVADSRNHRIREVDLATGAVRTVAGSSAVGPWDGPALNASFRVPSDVAVAADGRLLIVDRGNSSIRTLSADKLQVATLVHSGSGSKDSVGSDASFYHPEGLAADRHGNVYAADYYNHRIRKIAPDGTVETLAGTGMEGWRDGPGDQAQFKFPEGVAVDADDNVYVADKFNHRIRKITPDGVVSTVAGDGNRGPAVEAVGAAARFNEPVSLAFDPAGNLHVADSMNHVVRKIDADGRVTTVAGTPGVAGNPGASGPARFRVPTGIAFDTAGNLYVADSWNRAIRKVTPSGVVSTLAGGPDGEMGYVNGVGADARFNAPVQLVVDAGNNVYVTDYGNHVIRKVRPSGWVETLEVPSSKEIRTGSAFPFGIALSGRRLVYSSDDHLATIDFAP